MQTRPLGTRAELLALVAIALAAAGSSCADEPASGKPPSPGPEAASGEPPAAEQEADYRSTLAECLRTRHFEHCVDQAYRQQAPPCDPALEPIPLVHFDAPRPERAERDVAGWVELEAAVGPAGAPERLRVVAAEPPGVFEEAAIRTFRRWRYCARAHQGKLVRARLEFDASR